MDLTIMLLDDVMCVINLRTGVGQCVASWLEFVVILGFRWVPAVKTGLLYLLLFCT